MMKMIFHCRIQNGDFPYHLLPHIIPAGKVVGHTFEVFGLPMGVPVFVAMGDVQCAMQAMLSSPHDAGMGGGGGGSRVFLYLVIL